MRTILYCRVSDAHQTIEHQVTQARDAGFLFDDVLADSGVSGVTTKLAERPQGRRLFDLLRRGDVLIVRWVDRLGRDYQDVSDNLREFMRRGVIVKTIIHGMVFDGSTTNPMEMAVRDALIGFMAATAQAQAEATKAAQRAGIEYAKAKQDRYRGRKPSYSREQFEAARIMLSNTGVSAVAKATGLSRQTVDRIKRDPAGAESALAAWNA